MKIAIVTETYPPEINGVALTVESLVNNLLKLGHQVLLIRPSQSEPGPTHRHLHDQQVRSIPLPRYRGLRFGLATPRKIRKLLDQFGPDAAYIATEGPLGWASLRVARNQKIPVLTGFHTHFDQYLSHYGLGVIQRSVGNYMRRFHNNAHGTLVPTQGLKELLEQQGYRNVLLLERAVDTIRFNPIHRDDTLRRSWRVTDREPVAIHVGRIAAEKNIDLAIAAYRAIQTQHPKARMIVVGDGPARAQIQLENPDIIFTGALTGEALSAHYASADLFIFPSMTDTFGNVVLEALASGVPVAAYDYAAAADFIRPGVNGFLAPLGNDQRLIANTRVLANICCELPVLRQGAQDAVANHQPIRVAERLVELLRRRRFNPSAADKQLEAPA